MLNVVSFYYFTDLRDPHGVRDRLQSLCDEQNLLGTVLIAKEGVNGTLAGDGTDIRFVFTWLRQELALEEPIDGRWTDAETAPFRRMRVRVKKEVVTLGRPDILPHKNTGKHVSPEEWNTLIANSDTLVIDTRNHYEIEVGTFPEAVDPGTDSFREFPRFAEELAKGDKSRPLAMFCTGGIRCEKATALMLELGFEDVSQLQGGVLNYLDQVDDKQNRWNGECFVFDTRVAVDRDLATVEQTPPGGAHRQCVV